MFQFSVSLPILVIICPFEDSHPSGYRVEALVAQLCPTLCDSMECSLPGSSVLNRNKINVHFLEGKKGIKTLPVKIHIVNYCCYN